MLTYLGSTTILASSSFSFVFTNGTSITIFASWFYLCVFTYLRTTTFFATRFYSFILTYRSSSTLFTSWSSFIVFTNGTSSAFFTNWFFSIVLTNLRTSTSFALWFYFFMLTYRSTTTFLTSCFYSIVRTFIFFYLLLNIHNSHYIASDRYHHVFFLNFSRVKFTLHREHFFLSCSLLSLIVIFCYIVL